MIRVSLSAEETATILAALRFYQSSGQASPANRSLEIDEIATDGNRLSALNEFAVDELCETLNCTPDLNGPVLLAAVVEGGVVTAIVTDNLEFFEGVTSFVLDYDCEGADSEDMFKVPQSAPEGVKLDRLEVDAVGQVHPIEASGILLSQAYENLMEKELR